MTDLRKHIRFLLEADIDKQGIYCPTDPEALIKAIEKWKNKPTLKTNIPLDPIRNDQDTRLRAGFNEIVRHLDSKNLSKKTRAKLESANASTGKGNIEEKIEAMGDAWCDPESIPFWNEPALQRVLGNKVTTKKTADEKLTFKDILIARYWPELSLDYPLSNSEENGNTFHNIIPSASGDPAKLLEEKEEKEEEEKEREKKWDKIRFFIKDSFKNEPDSDAVEKILLYSKYAALAMEKIRISKKKSKNNDYKKMYPYYVELRSNSENELPLLTQHQFSLKIGNVLRNLVEIQTLKKEADK